VCASSAGRNDQVAGVVPDSVVTRNVLGYVLQHKEAWSERKTHLV